MGQRLLIVDSDRTFLKEQQVSLEAAFETEVASSPDGVIPKLESGAYAAVLICVEVADNKGYALCTAIRKNPALADVKVAMISSKATEEEYRRHQSLKGRADLYLHKPIAPSGLVAALNPFVPMRSVDPDNPLGDLADSDLGEDWLDGLKSDIASEVDGPLTVPAPLSNQTVAIPMSMIREQLMAPPAPAPGPSAAQLAENAGMVAALQAQVGEMQSALNTKDDELRRVQADYDQLRHSHDSVTQNMEDLERRQAESDVLKQRLADAETALKQFEDAPKDEHPDKLKAQLREAMGERTELLQQVEVLNNQVAEKTTRVMTLLKEKDRFQQQSLEDQTKLEGMNALQAERDAIQQQHEAATAQLQVIEAAHQEAQVQVAKLAETEGTLATVQSDLQQTQKSLASKAAEHAALSAAHAELQTQHQAKSEAHADLEAQLKTAGSEVSALEVTVRGQGRELVELGNRLAAKDKEIESHQARAGELEGQLQSHQEELKGKAETLASLETTHQELQASHQKAQDEWEAKAAEAETRLAEIQKLLQERDDKIEALMATVAAVQQVQETLERDKQVLNGQLAERQERLHSLGALLGEAADKLRKGADLAQG